MPLAKVRSLQTTKREQNNTISTVTVPLFIFCCLWGANNGASDGRLVAMIKLYDSSHVPRIRGGFEYTKRQQGKWVWVFRCDSA